MYKLCFLFYGVWCIFNQYLFYFCRFIFINNNNIMVCIISYGVIIIDILMLDKNGVIFDISLGFNIVVGKDV